MGRVFERSQRTCNLKYDGYMPFLINRRLTAEKYHCIHSIIYFRYY